MQSKYTKPELRLALTLIAATLTLGSCASLTGGDETDRALCTQFRPISWSTRDTDQTIREVKAHNAVGVAVCSWEVPGE